MKTFGIQILAKKQCVFYAFAGRKFFCRNSRHTGVIRDFRPDFEEKKLQKIPHKTLVFKGHFLKLYNIYQFLQYDDQTV